MPQRVQNPNGEGRQVALNTGLSEDRIRIPADVQAAMLAHLQSELPNEGCGLIAFQGDRPVKIFPGENVLASPSRYRMKDSQVVAAIDEIESHGWRLGAIYHSHPTSAPEPSATDLREANWPDALMIIVSFQNPEPEMRAYDVQDPASGTVRPVPIEILAPVATGRFAGLKETLRRAIRWGEAQPGHNALPSATGAASIRPTPWLAEHRTTIGVLGGMGPAATADLYTKLIQATPATNDQEHIPVVIYADPRVPDRTEALIADGEDPTPWMVRGIEHLAKAGADFVIIPCNTAHAFIDQLRAASDIEILSMVEIAANEIQDDYPRARTVGLLATSGTIRAGIYQEALKARGIQTIVPDEELQRHNVMPSIRAVKAGYLQDSVTSRLVEAAEALIERGAQVILAACTEIPVALTADDLNAPLVDATDSLARRAIYEAQQRDGRPLPRREPSERTTHELETA